MAITSETSGFRVCPNQQLLHSPFCAHITQLQMRQGSSERGLHDYSHKVLSHMSSASSNNETQARTGGGLAAAFQAPQLPHRAPANCLMSLHVVFNGPNSLGMAKNEMPKYLINSSHCLGKQYVVVIAS